MLGECARAGTRCVGALVERLAADRSSACRLTHGFEVLD